ncbi:MAG: hypothetical protein KF715_19600 [Candidatus Didemnitutus sp.]|nr:hypothetical protein [Candidatus Didemnitutus sp.]
MARLIRESAAADAWQRGADCREHYGQLGLVCRSNVHQPPSVALGQMRRPFISEEIIVHPSEVHQKPSDETSCFAPMPQPRKPVRNDPNLRSARPPSSTRAEERRVAFGNAVRVGTIEVILAERYHQTLSAKRVVFDFSRTRYIELFAQSLLFIWVSKITSRPEVVFELVPPQDCTGQRTSPASVLEFFRNWAIWEGYQKVGLRRSSPLGSAADPKADAEGDAAFAPLRQYYEFSFYPAEINWDAWVRDLQSREALRKIFPDDILKLSVVGEGGLRSIILGEIGKNAFEHGQGQATHVAIGGFAGFVSDSHGSVDQKLLWRIEAAPPHARSFLTSLGNTPYLEIIISDAGPGIPSTLRKPYRDDPILVRKSDSPSDAELIEYAFLLHSSSKPHSLYRGNARDAEVPLAPRGLFFVKNIARRNRALLVCRSGSAYCSWDFLSGRGSDQDGVFRSVAKDAGAALPGAQLQLIIPKLDESQSTKVSFSGATFPAGLPRAPVVVPVVGLLQEARSDHPKDVAQALLTGLHRHIQNHSRADFIVLDFINSSWPKDTKEKLYPLIAEICSLGLDGWMFGLLHTAHLASAIDELTVARNSGEPLVDLKHRLRPFLRLSLESGRLRYTLSGLTPIDANTAALLVEGSVAPIPEHLDAFVSTRHDGTRQLRFHPAEIESALLDYRRGLLQQTVDDARYGIFHPGRFVLPTGPYVENFYEIATMLESTDGRTLLREALLALLAGEDFRQSLVICLSPIGREIGHLLEEGESFSSQKPTLLNLERLSDTLTTELPDCTGRTLLVTDVVISGTSLNQTIAFLRNKFSDERFSRLSVLTVVDRRAPEAADGLLRWNDGTVPLKSVFRRPTVRHDRKPTDWPFRTIRRVNADTWRVLREQGRASEIWNTEDFIEKASILSGAVRVGHYVSPRGPHYKYLFLTDKLVKDRGGEIVDMMQSQIEPLLAKAKLPPVTHILFPERSAGMAEVARRYSELYGGARIIALTSPVGELPRMAGAGPNTVVLALDSVSSTNQTMFALIDAASALRPKIVIACVLINQASELNRRFLSNIGSYADFQVHAFSLAQVGLPVYPTAASCPLCRRLDLLQELDTSKRFSALQATIDRSITWLSEKSIEAAGAEEPPNGDRIGMWARYRSLVHETQFLSGPAFAELEGFLNPKQRRTRPQREALFRACENEAMTMSVDRLQSQPDFLRMLMDAAADVALTSNDRMAQRAALEVTGVVSFEHFRALAVRFAIQHAGHPAQIELLLVEILLLRIKSATRTKETAELLAEISRQMANAGVTVAPGTRTRIAAVRRGVEYESVHAAAANESFATNVANLTNALTCQPVGVHPRLARCLLMLNQISTAENAQFFIANYYEGENGFADLAFSQILPAIAAIAPAIELLGGGTYTYLLGSSNPSLKGDVYRLQAAIETLNALADEGACDEDAIREHYYAPEIAEARARLGRWLGNETDRILQLLQRFACHVCAEVKDSVTANRARLKKEGIILTHTIPLEDPVCAIPRDIVVSVVDDLIDNCLKHAFPTRLPAEKRVAVTVTREERHVCVQISDNGPSKSGLSRFGLERLKELLTPFNAIVEPKPSAKGTTVEVRFPLK